MTDFAQPTVTSNYTDVLQYLKDRDVANATMLFTSDTNVPTDTLRYNRTDKRLEQYNGASWDAKEITNLADGAVSSTAKLADNVVGATKIRIENNTNFRVRNFAGDGDIGVMFADTSDNTWINAATSKKIKFGINSSELFNINGNNFDPVADVTQKLGTASRRYLEGNIRDLTNTLLLQGSGGALVVKTASSHSIEFHANSSKRWEYNNSGHHIPATTATYNSGSTTLAALGTYTRGLYSDDSNNLLIQAPTGQTLFLKANGGSGGFFQITGPALLASAANTVSIGANGGDIASMNIRNVLASSGQDLNLKADNGAVAYLTISGAAALGSSNNAFTLGSASVAFSGLYTRNIAADTAGDLAIVALGTNKTIGISADGDMSINCHGGGFPHSILLDQSTESNIHTALSHQFFINTTAVLDISDFSGPSFNFLNQAFDASPGALVTYWRVQFGGVERLIPIYAPS